MCKSEDTVKEDIKGMAALGREDQGRKKSTHAVLQQTNDTDDKCFSLC